MTCKAKQENNGVCPHHNLQCGWPQCNEPAQPYPENFIDALTYDVARRDSESAELTDWQERAMAAEAVLAKLLDEKTESVVLPEKTYEFVPTPEPAKWHHPECEGECIACLIERVVQEAYGSQGLSYLQRHLTSPPAQRTWVGLTDEEIQTEWVLTPQNDKAEGIWFGRRIEAKLKEKNT